MTSSEMRKGQDVVEDEGIQASPDASCPGSLSKTTVQLDIQSCERLFPEADCRVSGSSALSILDAIVARFAPTGAIWAYAKPSAPLGQVALSIPHLKASLQKTVNAYPQWAGQLHRAPYSPSGDHTQRYGRLMLSYGSASDPGIEVAVAHCPLRLDTLTPTPSERALAGVWDAHEFPSDMLLSATSPLALHDMIDEPGFPGMVVQLTTFACGGIAIAILMAHPLADAQGLMTFVRDWAAVNRAISTNEPIPPIAPTFDPQLLDKSAAGDLDAPNPQQEFVVIAEALPLLRYDYWASNTDSCPPFFFDATRIPQEITVENLGPMGQPIPWSEWDIAAPVSRQLVYFSGDEVKRIKAAAVSSQSRHRISSLDAVLAHIWILIIRARGLEQDEHRVNMAVSIGVRSRLDPPLPDSFLGSPIVLAGITHSTGKQTSDSLGDIASSIRHSLMKFNAPAISALLHEQMFLASAQRLWGGFLGLKNTIVTSWLRQDAYAVDFGTGLPPRYVDAVMPDCDGVVHVMEGGLTLGKEWDGDMTVSLQLRTDVMENLLSDPLLRKYRHI